MLDIANKIARQFTEDEDAPIFRAMVLLTCMLRVGYDSDKLVNITGYDRKFVEGCVARCKLDNIIEEACWGDDALFVADACVCLGKVVKRDRIYYNRDNYIIPNH
jgi:hypothetical protein